MEIKAVQREYMTMIGVLNEFVTPCPHDKETTSFFGADGCSEVIRVGSTACQMCPYFKGMDYERMIINCSLE